MDAVRAFRDNRRLSKQLKVVEADITAEKKALDAVIQVYMERGLLAISMKVDGGGNVHQKHEVWGSVPDDKVEEFQRLMDEKYAGTDFDLRYMIAGKPNAQSLRGWINERLDGDETKTAEQRLRGVVPDDLLACLNVTDKYYTNANGL